MKYRKMVLITLLSLGFIVPMFTIYNRFFEVNYIATQYEKEVIEYFKEIALDGEFDSSPKKIIKWKKSMILFVLKEKENKSQMKVINEVIKTINELTSDGFKIELTEDNSKANAILYLLKKDKVKKLDSHFFAGIDNDFAGLSEAQFNPKSMIISNAKIFIDIEEPIEIQKSIILEEITQSIGLMNDSEIYSNSIFYENQMKENITNLKYSMLDRDIIKLLYHPRMKSGLNVKQAERVIKRILKNKEIELSDN